MSPKSKPRAMLRPSAWEDLKLHRGNLRRQIIKAIDSLEQDLRPSESKQLMLIDDHREVRRLRFGQWRILYLVLDEQPLILAIRRRPPYDYADLASLVEDTE
jgi:mRNA-degrading endonuclease RelE of RelBE toxin-antitoxin system